MLSECFQNTANITDLCSEMLLFLLLFKDFERFEEARKQWQKLPYLLEVCVLHRHSEKVQKGFVVLYVYLGCSERIRNTLKVYEQFGKCSERILKFGKDTGNDRKAFVMF